MPTNFAVESQPDLTDSIVAGEAFRALNLLIDQKAGELGGWINGIKSAVEHAFTMPSGVSVRVSYEVDGRREFPLKAEPSLLVRDLAMYLEEITKLDHEIGELQRFKLRLLNDYDFTHGDDTEQKSVFAPAPRF